MKLGDVGVIEDGVFKRIDSLKELEIKEPLVREGMGTTTLQDSSNNRVELAFDSNAESAVKGCLKCSCPPRSRKGFLATAGFAWLLHKPVNYLFNNYDKIVIFSTLMHGKKHCQEKLFTDFQLSDRVSCGQYIQETERTLDIQLLS